MIHRSHSIRFFPDGDGGDGGSGDGTGDGDGSGDGEEGDGEELTPEEIKEMREENERLKSAAAKSRTAAARETKAARDKAAKDAKEAGASAELQKQLDEERAARTALETKLQRQSATTIATELGAVDPGVVITLVDWENVVDPSDPAEVKQAIRALLKEKPFLKKPTTGSDAGEGRSGGSKGSSMNDIIRAAAGR